MCIFSGILLNILYMLVSDVKFMYCVPIYDFVNNILHKPYFNNMLQGETKTAFIINLHCETHLS